MTTGRITIIHQKTYSPSFSMSPKHGDDPSPRTPFFYLLRGRILYSFSQYDSAVRDFRTALRMNWRYEQAASWLEKAERATKPESASDPASKA
jgi:tetratricopeptide (TPR) repeat protein